MHSLIQLVLEIASAQSVSLFFFFQLFPSSSFQISPSTMLFILLLAAVLIVGVLLGRLGGSNCAGQGEYQVLSRPNY